MWCRHKFGKIVGEHQYCNKCGKAIIVPCSHKWYQIKTIQYIYGATIILQCSKCGEVKTKEI